MIQNKIKKVSNFLFLLLICITNPAFAAPSFWTPPAEDASINFLLNKFFGKAMPDIGLNLTEGQDPFASMFSFFNAAILTLGCIFIAYTLIVGTMQTAHEGEMLGKQWSSMWIPIRTAMGVGLVVPLSSGYCTAQLLVMWLTVQGVGLADELWKFFVNGTMSSGSLLMSMPSPKSVDLAKNVLKITTCLEGLRYLEANNNEIAQFSMAPSNGQYPRTIVNSNALGTKVFKQKYTGFGYTTGAAPGYKTYNVRVGNETRSITHYSQDVHETTEASQSICGFTKREISITKASLSGGAVWAGAGAGFGLAIPIPGASIVGGVVGTAIGSLIYGTNIIESSRDAEAEKVTEAHDRALEQMFANLKPTAFKLITNEAVDANDFDNSIITYNKMVENALMSKFNADFSRGFTENAIKHGWMMAGSWFARISALINLINKEANALPETHFNSKGLSTLPPAYTERISDGILRTTNIFNQSALSNNFTLGLSTQVIQDINAGKINKIVDEDDKNMVEKFTNSFTGLDIAHLRYDTRHPMITIQEMGVSMLQWIVSGLFGLVGVGLAGAVWGNTLASLLGPLLGIIVFIGIGAAITMAIYVPIMPFVLFLGATLSWIIMVFEAMIAAPLWAVMHLAPGGNDIMGNARQGYQLLLALLLRPALLIFGFAAAVIIIYPFGMFLNAIFFETFLLSQGEPGKGLFGFVLFIGATAIYAGLVLKFLHKAFDLIHIVPDQLLKWIGGATSSDMGSTAGKLNEGGNTAIVAVGQQSHQAGQTIGRAPMDLKQALGAQEGAKQQKIATQDQLENSASKMKSDAMDSSVQSTSAQSQAMQAEQDMNNNPGLDNRVSQLGLNADAAKKFEKSANANDKIAQSSNPNISPEDKLNAQNDAKQDRAQAERHKSKNNSIFESLKSDATNASEKANKDPENHELQEKAFKANSQASSAATLLGKADIATQFQESAENHKKAAVSTSPSPDTNQPGSGSGDGGGGPPPNDPPPQGGDDKF